MAMVIVLEIIGIIISFEMKQIRERMEISPIEIWKVVFFCNFVFISDVIGVYPKLRTQETQ